MLVVTLVNQSVVFTCQRVLLLSCQSVYLAFMSASQCIRYSLVECRRVYDVWNKSRWNTEEFINEEVFGSMQVG